MKALSASAVPLSYKPGPLSDKGGAMCIKNSVQKPGKGVHTYHPRLGELTG